MRLELCRSHLEILPEGEADLAYIEDTLGLRKAGNQIPLIRIDYAGVRAALKEPIKTPSNSDSHTSG